jgi:hypothetical protein
VAELEKHPSVMATIFGWKVKHVQNQTPGQRTTAARLGSALATKKVHGAELLIIRQATV